MPHFGFTCETQLPICISLLLWNSISMLTLWTYGFITLGSYVCDINIVNDNSVDNFSFVVHKPPSGVDTSME